MFKNSKMLKGFVLALALVLVLGGGFALKLNANAEANTVVLYVSATGNNTTGKDAATAFTDIADATAAANDMNLAPGTEVKILVVDSVRSESRNLDGETAKDSAGGKLHFTITSADSANKASIVHHAFNSSGSTSYEKIILSNNITFKNVDIIAEAQPYYQNNAPITGTVDYGKLYRTRNLHIGGNTVEFDNCEITSTIPDKSKNWVLYCDGYASSTAVGGSHLRLLNGDYSNCTVYVQDQVLPLWDLSLYVENASTSTVYALADTDQGLSVNAKSVTCTFKNATVGSYNPQGRGQIGVTEGVTAIFEDTTIKNWVGCMGESSGNDPASLDGDLRYIFRGDNNVSVTTADANGEKILYMTPYGEMNGDLHVTVEGGTFNNAFCTGSGRGTSVLNGNIYNEFKGGTFKAGIYCGNGRGGGKINGSIFNNFYDGFNLASGTSYFGGRLGVISGDVVNNWYGGTVAKVEIYMGGGYSDSAKTCILEGDLITNVYGGTFGSTFWGGPRGQTVEGGIYNTFMGGTFASTFVAGGLQVITPELHNVFKNGPDGQHATLSGTAYLGPRGGSVANTYNIGKLYNTFEGDVYFKGTLYCADGTQGDVDVEELVYNEFKGGTFGDASSDKVFCTTATKKNVLQAEVINNFYDGATFTGRVYGGGQTGGSGSITNNWYGGLFMSYAYGCSEITDNGKTGSAKVTYDKYTVNGDVTNNFYGATFNSQLICGGMADCDGLLTNNFYGGTFKYFVYGNSNSGNLNDMDVVNNIYGGDFQAWFCGGSNKSMSGTITNNVYGGHFMGTHKEALHSEAGRMCFIGGDYSATGSGETVPLLTNNIYGGIFEERVYLGGRIATIDKIESMIAGGIFNGDRLQPGMHQHSASNKATITLDIKPDESDNTLFLGSRYTPYGVEGAKVYWSCGLESLDFNRTTDTITLHGAKKPIYIAGNSFLNFDKVAGEVTFIQTENWVDGNAYVTVPEDESLDMITILNGDASITGSAAVTTAQVNIEDGKPAPRVALIGSASATAPEAVTIPGLAAMNFVLDNNLQVNFYVKKADLESYLAKAGTFTYQITCEDDVIASGNIATIDDADIVGDYVKIKTDLAIAAFDYGKILTIDFAWNMVDYTVYDLLQEGMVNSAGNTALVDLLKAIYNYGVEAEKLRAGSASVSDFYSEITYTGNYDGKASATSADASVKFYGTGLSIGKDVSLNFYLKAASLQDLEITAASAEGALDASRVLITPFNENSNYNVVISLKLDVASMDEVFTVSVKNASGTELATCSNCVAYSCASYIAQDNDFASVSKALLAYVEKAQAL